MIILELSDKYDVDCYTTKMKTATYFLDTNEDSEKVQEKLDRALWVCETLHLEDYKTVEDDEERMEILENSGISLDEAKCFNAHCESYNPDDILKYLKFYYGLHTCDMSEIPKVFLEII